MAVFRIVTLVCVLATCGAAAAAPRSNASKPTEWRSYYLLDVRNSRGPVALLKDVAHRTHLLLRSGGSWHDATPHGLTWWIEDVYFLDQRRGWLVANDCAAAKGAVYRTEDGGRNWRQLPWGFSHGCAAGSDFSLMFVDRRQGWVMGPVPTGPAAFLFRTQDGGLTWRYNEGHDMPVLSEVVFTTMQRGWGVGLSWLYSGPLYRTVNSGRTWNPQPGLPEAR